MAKSGPILSLEQLPTTGEGSDPIDAPAIVAPAAPSASGTSAHGTTTTKTVGDVIIGERGQAVASPTSTEEEDRVSLGQRTVNLIWENTQAKIAIAVVYVVLFVAAALSLAAALPGASEKQIALAITAFMLLSSLSTLVIGFYYGRTNHQKIGGIEQGR